MVHNLTKIVYMYLSIEHFTISWSWVNIIIHKMFSWYVFHNKEWDYAEPNWTLG